MKLFIVRHGQSTANVRRILQGQRIDEGLTEAGRKQAQEVALKLEERGLNITRLYASPLRRAKETAEIISDYLEAEIVFYPELMEKDFGELSGLAWEADTRENRVTYDYREHGGECDEDVRARLKFFLNELRNVTPSSSPSKRGRVALAVTHGGIIQMMRHIHGMPIQEENFENGSIHEVEI